ncbi:hypothetical protein CC78DRAFT_591895 [Lojkania enalia]|uniref:Uncharacterized protein n=1 Tax=Lojkania enalia TaxID=147567 RepID=A0A9P4KE47_9PLEO|nr:hypothetical protein CC78DRAFT_591895 [Didymosphaeria enalia]
MRGRPKRRVVIPREDSRKAQSPSPEPASESFIHSDETYRGDRFSIQTEIQELQTQNQLLENEFERAKTQIQVLKEQCQIVQKQNKQLTDAHEVAQLQRSCAVQDQAGQEKWTDEQFIGYFHDLSSSIRALSRVLSPSPAHERAHFLAAYDLLRGVPQETWSPRPNRKYLFQAAIWSLIMRWVFTSPLSIFGEYGCPLSKSWITLYGQGHIGGWPTPTLSSEAWRVNTVGQMAQRIGLPILLGDCRALHKDQATRHMQLSTMDVQWRLCEAIAVTIHTLIPGLDSELTMRLRASTGLIVAKAFKLAYRMFTRSCRLQLVYPQAGDAFSVPVMLSVDETCQAPSGKVKFVASPGLIKWGDSEGSTSVDEYSLLVAPMVNVDGEGPEVLPPAQSISDKGQMVEDVECEQTVLQSIEVDGETTEFLPPTSSISNNQQASEDLDSEQESRKFPIIYVDNKLNELLDLAPGGLDGEEQKIFEYIKELLSHCQCPDNDSQPPDSHTIDPTLI